MIARLGIGALVMASLVVVAGGCAAPPAARSSPGQVQVNINFSSQDQGGSYKKIERGSISGISQHVGFYYSINPDCSLNGLVRTQLKTPPAHGSVEFLNADGYTSFPSTSPAYSCNRRKSPGVAVMYTSDKDFAGTDNFAVQAIGPNGRYMETEYTVRVLAPK
jgi:hypothetical protein